jgi:rhodanese-related sulfurtransferase
MTSLTTVGALRACLLGVLFFAAPDAFAQAMGPEAVHDMQTDKTGAQRVEVLLLDAGAKPGTQPALPDASRFPPDVNIVYACWSLSKRRCRDEVLRQNDERHPKISYLTGTPHEWVATGISFSQVPPAMLAAKLKAMTTVSVEDLASARKDATEFTLIDVRAGLDDAGAGIDGAIRMAPVELSEKGAMLPKNGWIVLYDDGGNTAAAAAEQLRLAGFPMAVSLEGGFPAWITSERR